MPPLNSGKTAPAAARNASRKSVSMKCLKIIISYVSSMKEPEYVYTCQSCFRCVQECTKGIFSRVINPEYREPWEMTTSNRILSTGPGIRPIRGRFLSPVPVIGDPLWVRALTPCGPTCLRSFGPPVTVSTAVNISTPA